MSWNYQMPPYPWMMPPNGGQQPLIFVPMPTPPQAPPPDASAAERKAFKKHIRLYKAFMAEMEGKKPEKKDEKKDSPKGFWASLSPVQAFSTILLLFPAIFLLYGYMTLTFLQAAAHMMK